MTFRVISVGWDCADWIERTLASIDIQQHQDYSVHIVDDMTADPRQQEIIAAWCDSRDERWMYTFNTERKFALRNQVEGIRAMNPDPDDVIVWLDLDGDQLAHPHVFNALKEYYAGAIDLTYGQYEPVPNHGTSTLARPYPADVVASGMYRTFTLLHGCRFNHLRTMRARIFQQIPESEYKDDNGEWLTAGADYVMMMCGLELAYGRYACVDQVLMFYNHAQPHPDNKYHPQVAHAVNQLILRRPSLQWSPSPTPPRSEPMIQRFLEADERRQILREYGQKYGVRVFVETGTNLGDTPWFLRNDFTKLYTIELSSELYNAAVDRFSGTPQVQVVQGDSTDLLPQVLASFEGPALVWLDGHHSGPGTAHGTLDTPVVQELEALFADGRSHIILVDDARIFDGQPEHNDEPHYGDYPSVEWVHDLARANGYDCELRDDIIRLTPKAVA